jgi:hypothetical protein
MVVVYIFFGATMVAAEDDARRFGEAHVSPWVDFFF